MTTNPFLDAIDNPEEAAYLASRRRSRRRKLLAALAVLVVVATAIGWKVGRHVSASIWLESQSRLSRVIWGTDAKNWKLGGATSVKLGPPNSSFSGDVTHISAEFQHLAWLHRLEELDLTNLEFLVDSDLEILEKLTSLRVLNLDRSRQRAGPLVAISRLTDATVDRIQAIKGLKSLNLGGHAITDAGVARLAGLDQLEDVELRRTQITDASLATLKGLPRLKSLDLSGTRVTAGAIAAFENARPEVKIIEDATSNQPIPGFGTR